VQESIVIQGLFITGTGTSAGKTFISRGLASALRHRGRRVAALKPIETGVEPDALDALALAAACGRPELANPRGLYRAAPPLSPYAVTLETDSAAPDLPSLVGCVRVLAGGSDALIVEGAGGLLVPLDARATIADFAALLALPLLIVARDQLGVLSSVLTCVESAQRRALSIAGIVLAAHEGDDLESDRSRRTNRPILEQRTALPVLTFPVCADDDRALAHAAEECGLVDLFLTLRAAP
jgi:dethiobiotin synthetase